MHPRRACESSPDPWPRARTGAHRRALPLARPQPPVRSSFRSRLPSIAVCRPAQLAAIIRLAMQPTARGAPRRRNAPHPGLEIASDLGRSINCGDLMPEAARFSSARPPAYVIAPTLLETSALLRLPEDLVDVLDLGQQRVGRGHIGAALRAAATAGQLGSLVEQLVQLRVLLEVRRLEVVRPQHPQMVLHEFGPLLLDQQSAGPECRVVVVVVLLDDRLDGLGLDPGLGWIIDAAGQVAVSVRDGPRLEETCEQPHRSPSLMSDHGYRSPTLPPSVLGENERDACAGRCGGWRGSSGPWSRVCGPATGYLSAGRPGRLAGGKAGQAGARGSGLAGRPGSTLAGRPGSALAGRPGSALAGRPGSGRARW